MNVFRSFDDYKRWVSLVGLTDIREEALMLGWLMSQQNGDDIGIILSIIDLKWINDETERVGVLDSIEAINDYVKSQGVEEEMPAEMMMLVDLVGLMEGAEAITDAVLNSIIQYKRALQKKSGELEKIVAEFREVISLGLYGEPFVKA